MITGSFLCQVCLEAEDTVDRSARLSVSRYNRSVYVQ